MVAPNNPTLRKNPFGNRGTLTDTSLFYGRDRELRTIADKINSGQSVSIYGQRTIGKSSLLSYLANAKERWEDWGFDEQTSIFVPINIARETRLTGDELLPFLASEAAKKIGDKDFPENPSQSDAHNWLSSMRQKQIIFLLDEFEFIGQIPGIEPRHFSYLRSMINLTRLVFITASRDSLYDLTGHISVLSSPFFNIFHDLRLKHFSENEARQMVFGRNGERNQIFTESDFKRLCEMSGNLPMILSLTCHQLYDLRTARKEVMWESLEENLAEKTHDDYRYFWDQYLKADPDRQKLLMKLESDQPAEFEDNEKKQLEKLEVVGLVVRTNNGKLKVVPGLRPVIEEAIRKAGRRSTGSLSGETTQSLQRSATLQPRLGFSSPTSTGGWQEGTVPKSYETALPAVLSNENNSTEGLQRMLSQLLEVLAGPRMDNYRGHLCVALKDCETGQHIHWEDQIPLRASAERQYQLQVWFSPERPKDAYADWVEVRDGQDSQMINFLVAIDSDTLEFRKQQDQVQLNPDELSPVIEFPCQLSGGRAKHSLWIQLFQKNRLIQVLPLQINVE